jgi:hypothetical protein
MKVFCHASASTARAESANQGMETFQRRKHLPASGMGAVALVIPFAMDTVTPADVQPPSRVSENSAPYATPLLAEARGIWIENSWVPGAVTAFGV